MFIAGTLWMSIFMDTYFFEEITEEIESEWKFVSFIGYHNGYFTFNILYIFSEIHQYSLSRYIVILLSLIRRCIIHLS